MDYGRERERHILRDLEKKQDLRPALAPEFPLSGFRQFPTQGTGICE